MRIKSRARESESCLSFFLSVSVDSFFRVVFFCEWNGEKVSFLREREKRKALCLYLCGASIEGLVL